jgi:hypothetical protein
MDHELNTQERAMTPESKNSYSDTVLAHALLISAGARDELTQAKAVRAEAEKRREEAEADAARVLDELFAEANLRAQKLMERASAIEMEAEADRAKARQEIEDAMAARIEAETRCRQIEAEARENAEKIIQEALHQADIKAAELRRRAEAARIEAEAGCRQIEAEARENAEKIIQEALHKADIKAAELKRRTEEEVRKLLVDAVNIHATAQEEMETQRILSDAARIQARTAHLQGWANNRSAPQPHSIDHDLSDIHEPAHAEPGEAAPVEDMEPQSPYAPAYENGHKDPENGLVETEHRRYNKES